MNHQLWCVGSCPSIDSQPAHLLTHPHTHTHSLPQIDQQTCIKTCVVFTRSFSLRVCMPPVCVFLARGVFLLSTLALVCCIQALCVHMHGISVV